MTNSNPFPIKTQLSFQYFLYFGVMGMVLPYFNLYCFHIGFSGFQIGVISAVRSAVLVLFAVLWSLLADRFKIRRRIFLFALLLSTGIWSLYLLTIDFWHVLIITIGYGIFYSPIISFLEAFTMDALGEDKANYGKIRVWGSISFIAVVVLIGKLTDTVSIEIILIIVLILSGVQAVGALWTPHDTAAPGRSPDFQAAGLMKLPIIMFLCCAFLMLASHGTYYGFYSIHLEQLGFNRTFIGMMWAVAVTAEILIMVKSRSILNRFSIHQVLFFSFIAAVLRWFTLFYARSPYLIVFAQLLHAGTYAAFHVSSILYIDSLSPIASKTLGQATNNAVTYGFGLMAGLFVSGTFYDRLGTDGLFLVSGVVALAGGAIFFIFQRRQHDQTIKK